MKEYGDCDFFRLVECHEKAVAESARLMAKSNENRSGYLLSALEEALAIETQARNALIDWVPTTRAEAQFKLLYVVHHLIRTRGSLDHREMSKMLESIAHLRE